MGSIIPSHIKHILNSNSAEYGYNRNNRDGCPLENKCLTPRIVYKADVTKGCASSRHTIQQCAIHA